MSSLLFISDPEARRAVVAALEAAGHSTTIARDAAAFGAACDGREPAVVAIDGPLTDPRGLEVLSWLRKAGVTVPALIRCSSQVEVRAVAGEAHLRPFVATQDVSSEAIDVATSPSSTSVVEPERSGVLGHSGLAQIMAWALTTRWSGKVDLCHDGADKAVFFEHGQPVYCASKIFTENFGQMLLRRGVITEVEYEWARKIQQREGIRQGEALVKIGTLTHQDLYEQLRWQIEEKIVNAFGWPEATYELVDDDGFLSSINKFSYNPVALVTAGLARFDSDAMASAISVNLSHGGVQLAEGLVPRVSAFVPARSECRVGQESWVVACCDEPAVAEAVASWLGEAAEALVHPRRSAEFEASCGVAAEQAPFVVAALAHFGYIAHSQVETCLPSSRVASFEDDETVEGEDGDEPADLAERLSRAWLQVTSADHFRALGLDDSCTKADIERAREGLLRELSVERFAALVEGRSVRARRFQRKLNEIRSKIDVAASTLLDPVSRAGYVEARGQVAATRENSLKAEDEFLAGKSKLDDDPAAAREHFERACQYNPAEHTYGLFEGWARYCSGERQEGRIRIERAITANPMLDQGYVMLGRVFFENGDFEDALGQATTALTFNPDSTEAFSLLEQVRKARQNPERAPTPV